MYYVLRYAIPQDKNEGFLHLEDGLDFAGVPSWSLGRRFQVALPDPIEVRLVPAIEYSGPPSEMYDGHMCLMAERLVAALEGSGVDNLDHFPALLRNVKTGETFRYRAVNIIGLVAAADLGRSIWSSYDGDTLIDVNFDLLEVDTDATMGLLMFRLASSTNTILVHERVRRGLLAAGFETLRFLNPAEWVT